MLRDSQQDEPLPINYPIIEGSSPWVFGRNFKTKGDIIHANGYCPKFFQPDGDELTLNLIEHAMHCSLPCSKLYHDDYISTPGSISVSLRNFSVTVKRKDMKKLSIALMLMSADIRTSKTSACCLNEIKFEIFPIRYHYVVYSSELLQTFPQYPVVDATGGRQPLSLSTISHAFNDTVAVEQYHGDILYIFHCMDVSP